MRGLRGRSAVAGALESFTVKFLRFVSPLMVALGIGSLMPVAVRAQTLQEETLEQQGLAQQPTAGDWNVTLGAGIAARPTYPGASAYRARPIPLVSIAYRDLFFLGPFGLGMTAIHWSGFRAGPVIGFEGARDQSDDPHLNGLGDIPPSVTAGIFAAYRAGRFELSATARQAVTHSSNGLLGLVQLNYRAPIMPRRLYLVVGPDVEFADRQYERTWFGVSSSQSAQSGLPVFTPGAGVKDAGLHAILTYRYSDHVLLRSFVSVKELTGDAADSPVVQSKTQALIGAGVAYHF